MENATLSISDSKDDPTAEELMRNLDIDAATKGLPLDRSFLTVSLKNDAGELVGGVHGYILWGWLCIHYLWVREDERSHGIGTRLLAVAEEQAKERGCHGAFLNTMSFQAMPFYVKQGYQPFGKLENFCGHGRIFLHKDLQT